MTVAAVTPLEDKSVHYFSVYPVAMIGYPGPRWGTSVAEFALPYTRETADSIAGDTVQRYLSSEHFDCDAVGANCVKERSVFVAYEQDTDSTGLGQASSRFNTNRRLRSERTVYHTDGNRWQVKSFSDHDGLGHYRSEKRYANFDAGNSGETFTNWNQHQSSPISPTSRWLLGTDGRIDQIDGDTSSVLYKFDTATGFLNCVRTRESGTSNLANDLLVRYSGSSGNVTQERFYGGDRTPIGTSSACTDGTTAEYTIDHTYASGTRKSSKYAGFAWKTLDLDVDAGTGLRTRSRDSAGVATDYDFDAMARLVSAKPQGATGIAKEAWTKYVYGTSGFPSYVSVERCKSTSSACTGSDRLTDSYVDYDALGRVAFDGQRLPGGGFNIRRTLYDAAGNRWKVSSFKPELSGTYADTVYSGYDAFGRPQTITAPDGSITTIDYTGVRQVTTTQKIALSLGGGQTNVSRRETYDGDGRLFRVEEYSNPAAPSTYVKTDYSYDESGRLTKVCQNASGSTCGQERIFTFDNRGFLLSEQHPEKGPSGNGSVYYKIRDSRGKVWQRRDGADSTTYELDFTFDAAERVVDVTNFSGFLLKQYSYDSGTGAGAGKLATAMARNMLGSPAVNHEITETYSYSGRMGRVSSRVTALKKGGAANESWTLGVDYDEYGLPSSIDYPTCAGTGCRTGSGTAYNVTFGRTDGMLTSIPNWTSGTITYHPNLMVATVPHANGSTETIANDPNGLARPLSITANAKVAGVWTANAFATGTYAFDGAGNVMSMTDGTKVEKFKYDKVSRLTGSTLGSLAPSRSQNYAFDTFGNITSITTDGVQVTTPTSAATNRLNAPGTSYDPRGSLTAWNGQSYAWDQFRVMKERCTSGTIAACTGELWRYAYTADGERVLALKSDGSKEIWTLRNLDNKVLRRDDNGTVVSYVYRDDRTFGTISSAGPVRHFATDHLGTIRLVMDGDGDQKALHTYFPFGEEATALTQDTEVMKFTGHERDLMGTPSDDSDDLDYMHARSCSPITARFLSIDPAGGNPRAPQGWNRYAYVQGNALAYKDPTGRIGVLALLAPLAEVALTAADVAETVETISDGSRSGAEKILKIGLLAAGIVGPGGGLTKADDLIETAVSKAENLANWARKSKLANHFRRHGDKVGAKDASDYAAKASEFLVGSQSRRLPTKIGSDGTIRTYDRETNTFGSYNADGTTKTFYKPDPSVHGHRTNEDYWDSQKGVEPWEP